nr:hypothetical protein [Tanacetum cinerariifolium]
MPTTRPFFDSEHGPIYTFNNRRRTLPEAFDDAYFRHMQWAHFASGGAGGGLRWPYRQPHDRLITRRGTRRAPRSQSGQLTLPGLAPGSYIVHIWDTAAGTTLGQLSLLVTTKPLRIDLPTVREDLALAIVPAEAAPSDLV